MMMIEKYNSCLESNIVSNIRKRKVFSALEVAKICGVVNQTVINWIRADYLKSSITPGGQFRIYPDDLRDFLLSRNMRVPNELSKILHEEKSMIVVVDDDHTLNELLSMQLMQHFPGTEIKQAFDGFEAGAILATVRPKVVILDIELPGINGRELCKQIKSDSRFSSPLVLIASTLNTPNLEEHVKSEGADAFFRKPYDTVMIANFIRSRLKW